MAKQHPLAVLVSVQIDPARLDAFLQAMKIDVEGSRQEEGCLRFDLLRDQSDPHKFIFYEVYRDQASMDVHKRTPHYKAWTDFKEGGGVVSQSVVKCDAVDYGMFHSNL